MVIEGHVSPSLAVAAFGRYLRHVHVKDVVPRRKDGTWRWVHARPGSGLVAWPDVLEALGAAAYSGWLVVDHLSAPAGPARLRGDLAAFRRLLADQDARTSQAAPARPARSPGRVAVRAGGSLP
jgi:sugar phosphate isomerase/epimerase